LGVLPALSKVIDVTLSISGSNTAIL
jgi:hypothetical protein